jgi:hypothetical protein
VHSLAVLDVGTMIHDDNIAEFDLQIVASNFVDLNPPLLDAIRTQADKDCITSLLSSIAKALNARMDLSQNSILTEELRYHPGRILASPSSWG